MANPSIFVDSPRRRPRKGGIKSVANVVTTDRLTVAHDVSWLQESCDLPFDAPGLCFGVEVLDEKETEGIIAGASTQVFGLYAGVECWLNTQSDYEARAQRVLENGEDRLVEEKLIALLLGTAPAASSSWADAIGAAEHAADSIYIGQPVLVISRYGAVAAAAESALWYDQDGNIWTPNGTPVLATGKAADEDTLYITGDITLYQSGITTVRAVNPPLNREMAISERAYALAIDCDFVRAFTVTIP